MYQKIVQLSPNVNQLDRRILVLTPAFHVIWSRFRQMRRYFAHRPEKEGQVFRLLDHAAAGSPGHPFIFSFPMLWRLVLLEILGRKVGSGPAFRLYA